MKSLTSATIMPPGFSNIYSRLMESTRRGIEAFQSLGVAIPNDGALSENIDWFDGSSGILENIRDLLEEWQVENDKRQLEAKIYDQHLLELTVTSVRLMLFTLVATTVVPLLLAFLTFLHQNLNENRQAGQKAISSQQQKRELQLQQEALQVEKKIESNIERLNECLEGHPIANKLHRPAPKKSRRGRRRSL